MAPKLTTFGENRVNCMRARSFATPCEVRLQASRLNFVDFMGDFSSPEPKRRRLAGKLSEASASHFSLTFFI